MPTTINICVCSIRYTIFKKEMDYKPEPGSFAMNK